MKVLGYHISPTAIVTSEGEVCTVKHPLEFLLQPKRDTIRILYNLDYSVPFITTEGRLDYKELVQTTKLKVPPYHIRYIPGKLLSIKRVGAFAYYTDANQYVKYPKTDNSLSPIVLATRAKDVGDRVYSVLQELGLEVTSLTSPVRVYEKTQLKWLYQEKQKANSDPVKTSIIEGIGIGVFGDSWERYLKGTD